MQKLIARVFAITFMVTVIAVVVVMRRKSGLEPIDQAMITGFAQELGKGHDAHVLAKVVAYNKSAPQYVFALEVRDDEVIRHTTPRHIGEHVRFSTHPHIHEIVLFAQKQGAGTLTYDATNTPSACTQKRAYVMRAHGDDNKVYVVGQGYCLLK